MDAVMAGGVNDRGRVHSIGLKKSVFVWSIFFIVCGLIHGGAQEEVTMAAYFPEFMADPSEIRWAHAANSKTELAKALHDDRVHMLEADVLLGTVVRPNRPSAGRPTEPVMAHPPINESDLDLREWLTLVVNAKKRKGVKLDFKSIEVVEPSLKIIDELFHEITFPIWFNADILPGPVNMTGGAISTFVFLHMSRAHFPESTLSPGWSTSESEAVPPDEKAYSWQNVVEMAGDLHSVGVSQPVTFPVRAAFVPRSIERFRWLLSVVSNSTLTVWSGPRDTVDIGDLLFLRASLPVDRVYYDLPPHLDDEFHSRKNLDPGGGGTLKGGAVDACSSGRPVTTPGHLNTSPGNGCVLQANTAIVFLKPCRHVVDLPERSDNHSVVRLRGVLEFTRAQTSSASSQALVVKLGRSVSPLQHILVESGGKVQKVQGLSVLNTTRVSSSKCYAFQAEVADEKDDAEVSLWPIRCLYDRPPDPGADVAVIHIRKPRDGTVSSLNVESRGDTFKVFRNLGYVCSARETLFAADEATSKATSPCFDVPVFLLFVLNLIVCISFSLKESFE